MLYLPIDIHKMSGVLFVEAERWERDKSQQPKRAEVIAKAVIWA
jgi:hypothetical protein